MRRVRCATSTRTGSSSPDLNTADGHDPVSLAARGRERALPEFLEPSAHDVPHCVESPAIATEQKSAGFPEWPLCACEKCGGQVHLSDNFVKRRVAAEGRCEPDSRSDPSPDS